MLRRIQSTRRRCRGTDDVAPLRTERMRTLPRAPNVSKVRGRKKARSVIVSVRALAVTLKAGGLRTIKSWVFTALAFAWQSAPDVAGEWRLFRPLPDSPPSSPVEDWLRALPAPVYVFTISDIPPLAMFRRDLGYTEVRCVGLPQRGFPQLDAGAPFRRPPVVRRVGATAGGRVGVRVAQRKSA